MIVIVARPRFAKAPRGETTLKTSGGVKALALASACTTILGYSAAHAQATPGGAHGLVPARVRAAKVLAGSGRQWRVWYWYSIGARATPDTREARLWQASQMLTTLSPARLSALAAPCVPDCDAALGILASFAAILGDNGNPMTHQSLAMPDNSYPAARPAHAGATP